jgi:hypothetical protein
MQNATINQLASGGHKSFPGEHLLPPWRLELLTINQCKAKCNNQSVNQWWVGLNHPQGATSVGLAYENLTIN